MPKFFIMNKNENIAYFFNKRLTTRFDVSIDGLLNVKIRDVNFNLEEEFNLPVHIMNISYAGIMFSYANNDFLFTIVKKDSIYNIYEISFNFMDMDFLFRLNIEWEKFLPETGKDCKIISGAIIANTYDSEIKDRLLTLLTLLHLNNVFLGLFPKEIEFNTFNEKILTKIDKEEYLNFLLKIYKQDIQKNCFIRKDNLEEDERIKFLEIIKYLGY